MSLPTRPINPSTGKHMDFGLIAEVGGKYYKVDLWPLIANGEDVGDLPDVALSDDATPEDRLRAIRETFGAQNVTEVDQPYGRRRRVR